MVTSPVSSGCRSEFEHRRLKFGKLVEKKHAVMRERDLAGLRAQTAADQRRHAGRVMRRAERPRVGQRAFGDRARHGCDHRDFEQLGRRERRQDRRQPRGEHRLAGAGRADHQQIVPAGRRDLERALGALLSLDVLQVERRALDLADLGARPHQHLRALEMVGELDQRVRRDDLHVGARPGGFRPAGVRADQPLPAPIRANCRGQHTGDRRNRAVEPELAKHGETADRIMRNGADRGHQAERNRQIEMATFLGQIRRRHVHGDAPRGQREAGGDKCGAHALARFGHGLVRQAHDVEGRQARRDLHLDVDGACLDALKRDRGHALNHAGAASPGELSQDQVQVARTFREHKERGFWG